MPEVFGLRRQLSLAALLLAVAVAASVWPFRSRHLFSWDSANYAFAVERIDISLHRPHPPGYLGYVFAARILHRLTGDVNAALVTWNVLALPTAAALTALLGASAGLSTPAALAAAVLLVTSPLVWFYTSVAEIYVSDLLWTAAIAYTAHAAVRGRAVAVYWCAAALACAALFKISTMVLMLPLAASAWYRTPPPVRVRSALLLLLLGALVAAIFVRIQPDFTTLAWHQFTSATANSRLVAPDTAGNRIGITVNRNARDTMTALLAALGFVNAVGLALWAIVDRRRPPALDRQFAALWVVPWLLEWLVVHIAKPGYVLPLLPLLCITVAGFYARRGRWALVTLVSAQLAANVAYVTVLTPPAASSSAVRYRDKSLLERLKSDLQPITFPTLATLSESDAHVNALLALDRSTCRSGKWVGVAGTDPIDWRRAMYYLPSARVIRLLPNSSETPSIGQNGDFTEVSPSGTAISSECGLLWIDDKPPRLNTSAHGHHVDGVGWVFPPGSGRVTRQTIAWTAR